ncbi:hypothetical protein [Streptomyces sp. NPDC088246]|uniref:hypothetical protein n=1 Tax=Streptomyces sp. NPDC088246 TaxID=3365842 RepID=UPI0037F28400
MSLRQRGLPLVKAALIPPPLQVQVQFRAASSSQNTMCGASGTGLDNQLQMRPRNQIEYQLSNVLAMEIREDDHSTAPVTSQRPHQLPGGAGDHAELVSK